MGRVSSGSNAFEEAGIVCPYTTSDHFATPVVISGKIYMVKETETKNVFVYELIPMNGAKFQQ